MYFHYNLISLCFTSKNRHLCGTESVPQTVVQFSKINFVINFEENQISRTQSITENLLPNNI